MLSRYTKWKKTRTSRAKKEAAGGREHDKIKWEELVYVLYALCLSIMTRFAQGHSLLRFVSASELACGPKVVRCWETPGITVAKLAA